MKITESLQLALKNIVSSKVRTLLTMLGIIIGVAAVIVIVGLGNGLETYVTDSFSSLGTNTLTVSVMSRGSTRSLDAEDFYEIVADNSQYLDLCSPTVPMMGYVKIGSETISSTTCTGVSEDYLDISGMTVASGRGLQYSDMLTRSKVCVIGAYLNQAYFGGNAVGQTLRVGGQSLEVVGVLAQKGDTLEEGGSDDCLYLPYTTAERISGQASTYTVTMRDENNIDQSVAALEASLFAVFASDDYYTVTSMAEMLDTMTSMINILVGVLAGIAAISLVVGGIGIMNIMLVSVTERTREIGVRKSLGAKERYIMQQFVIEAATTSALGGIIGILIGDGLSAVATAVISRISEESLTALSPSKVSPTSATVAGVTYEIGTSQAAYQLSSQGQFQEGDLVTLLLGMNGEIVEVLDPQDSESTYYGSVVSSVKGSSTSSTSSSSTASAQVTTQVACTDGILRTFYHSGRAFEAGRLVTVSVSQSDTTVKGMSVSHLVGTVSADGGTLGKYPLASDVEILDTDEEGGYVRIYPSLLAGAKLSGDDVRYYTLNASGEIDRLILNEVTGDTYQYVYLSGITDSSSSGNGNIDNISVSYTYVLDGQTHSLSGSARYSAKVGGAVLQYEDGNLTSIIQLSGVTLDSLGSLSAMSGNQEYPLSEDVQVLLRDGTGIYAYYAASLSQINTEDYDLTGWYDDLGCAAGGRIRIITAVPK